MPEDLSQAVSLETEPEPQQPDPAAPPDDDAEPDGVVEVSPGRRMVDVSIVAAERKRARETTEKRLRDTEFAPLQQKANEADALRQALSAAQPYVDLVKQNQHLLQQQPQQSAEDQISDEEAEQEARELQLYGSDSQLDLRTAKRVIAKRRSEAYHISQQAVQAAIGPLQQSNAETASRQNFLAMAGLSDAQGSPLVDPMILAEEWVKVPAELTKNREVAETVLERAIGKQMRQGKRPAAPRSPVYSETSGGRSSAGPIVLTALDRKLGISEKDLKDSAKGFNPGGISVIGE